MLKTEEHITISNKVDSNDDLDFNFLRNKGQSYIEQLSRKFWTDYNIHDPGITIEEILCFVITDLGYALDKPIEDIMASKDLNFENMHRQFKSAKNIFTCKPVTANDYRKLFADIEGVKNCWLSIHELPLYITCNPDNPSIEFEPNTRSGFKTKQENVKGLYNVMVQFDEQANQEKVISEIATVYHKNRNLCEDLVEVMPVKKHCIRTCMEIQLENGVDEEWVHAKIIWKINQYLSPEIKRYSLTEMLDSGMDTPDIFSGPVLQGGFIKDDELEKSTLRKTVRLSDLIALIKEVDGVKLITDYSMHNCLPTEIGDECSSEVTASSDAWVICVLKNHLPCLCETSTFNYKKGFIPVGINQQKVQEYLTQFQEQTTSSKSNIKFEDLKMPMGKYAEIRYTTLQHHLPENYGISTYGLSANASKKRKVQAKQLQAYLLFFDQIFSTYFAQLEHVQQLLVSNPDLKQTYFFKEVENIAGFKDLLANESNYQKQVEQILGDLDNFNNRRNQLLDHLIARFAEVFEDYTNAMYKLFGKSGGLVADNILETKNKFLKEYDVISAERGRAFNYTDKSIWDTTNVSGFQKRIALLSGINSYNRRDLFHSYMYIDTVFRYNQANEMYLEYRWLLKTNDTVYLSSPIDFTTKQGAINHLLHILTFASDKDNFEFRQTQSNRYYVVLLDNENKIIGRQYNHYYSNLSSAKQRLEQTIAFIGAIIFDEGFYLIEHILTLPYDKKKIGDINNCLPICLDKDCFTCGTVDPFSYQVSIIFPGYTTRFASIDFRRYMENLIRTELPAHIMPKICWVGHIDGAYTTVEERLGEDGEMENGLSNDDVDYPIHEIQDTWHAFLKSKNRKSSGFMAGKNQIKELWCALNKGHNIYLNATLHDCENEETEETKNKIILNRSPLGSM
jgi:hypothetical protein